MNPQKGVDVVTDLLALNDSDNIVFHLFGETTDPTLRVLPRGKSSRCGNSRVVFHGPYDHREIVTMLRVWQIHVGVQPAIWAETFSYVVSELLAAGVPVITGNLGAQGERVGQHRFGWLVDDIRDARSTLALLHQILASPSMLDEAALRAGADGALRSYAEMWRDHRAIYRRASAALGERCTDEPPPLTGIADRSYVAYLAMRAAESCPHAREATAFVAPDGELERLRQQMRWPRYAVADVLANLLHRTPIWPWVARATDTVIRRRALARRPGRNPHRPA
jgi:hypothetical protein